MASVIGYSQILNTTGAVLTSAVAETPDWFCNVIHRRVFAAADIGADAGQTKDATDPTIGCLVAQFTGSQIMNVEILGLYRASAVQTTIFNFLLLGNNAASTALAWHNVYNSSSGLNSLYIFDADVGGPSIAAGDWITYTVQLGNSASITPIA